MRPLLLKGHSRSITYVTFNSDGDLLFSCSKDLSPAVWRAAPGPQQGERLGTYDGHTGAVYHLDVNRACGRWRWAGGVPATSAVEAASRAADASSQQPPR